MRKAAIILPTYNEALNIEVLIDRIFAISKEIPQWDIHIVVVDSDSPDDTANIVERLSKKYKVLHLLRTAKEGLGKAYVEGFKFAIDEIKPFVVFQMDADLSHDPEKIPAFLELISKGADFVIGSRYIPGGSIPKDWAPYRKFLSVVGNWIIRLGFMNLKISDWTSGYRAVKTWIIKDALTDIENYTGYVFQVALLDTAVKAKAQIREVPIHFIDRKEGDSKINSMQYTLHALLYVFLNSSFIKFGIVGVIGFGIDFGISYIFIEIVHSAVWLATLISTEIAIISNFILNNFWAFSHKKLEHGVQSLVSSFTKFNIIASGSILIQTVGVQLMANYFGKDDWYIYKILIIACVIIPYSYVLYNKFIWKDK